MTQTHETRRVEDATGYRVNMLSERSLASNTPPRAGNQSAGFKILNTKPFVKNTLQGFFDLQLPSGMIIRGCMLHEKNESRWVSFPSRRYVKDDGAEDWANVIDFDAKSTKFKFQDLVTPLAKAALLGVGQC